MFQIPQRRALLILLVRQFFVMVNFALPWPSSKNSNKQCYLPCPLGFLRTLLRITDRGKGCLVLPFSTLDPTLSKDLDHTPPLLTQILPLEQKNKGKVILLACRSIQEGGGDSTDCIEANFYQLYHISLSHFLFFLNVMDQFIVFNPKYFTEIKWGKNWIFT